MLTCCPWGTFWTSRESYELVPRATYWHVRGVSFRHGTELVLSSRRQGTGSQLALVAMMVLFIECAHVALSVFYPLLGSQPLAAAILREYQPGEVIVSDGEYSLTSSVNFYTGVQESILNGRINGLWYGSLFPMHQRFFWMTRSSPRYGQARSEFTSSAHPMSAAPTSRSWVRF